MPALKKVAVFEYSGIAVADKDEWFGAAPDEVVLSAEKSKAEKFGETYGGTTFNSYNALLADTTIDCVYIPLPPGLHYRWAKKALESGKHVLVEKPCTDSLEKTHDLIKIAEDKKRALHENYMFRFHSQIEYIVNEIKNKTMGDIRLIKIDFGFPFKGARDFRYNKALGGGALLDCGGYTVKLASILLGDSARVVYAGLQSKEGCDVDVYGNAVMVNDSGCTAHLAFGMDNSYQCALELWGSTGTLYTNRILTAPDGFTPMVKKSDAAGGSETEVTLEADDSFKKSIEHFYACIQNTDTRQEARQQIVKQAELVEAVSKKW
jgi:predicted dehydrogenase